MTARSRGGHGTVEVSATRGVHAVGSARPPGRWMSEAARKRQQRELAKSARDAERAVTRARREHTRVEKEVKQLYIQEQIEEAAEQTSELAQQMVELRSVLEQTLSVDDRIDFAALRMSDAYLLDQVGTKARIVMPTEIAV